MTLNEALKIISGETKAESLTDLFYAANVIANRANDLINELRAEIESLKCCGNCKHFESGHFMCSFESKDLCSTTFKTLKNYLNHWEKKK